MAHSDTDTIPLLSGSIPGLLDRSQPSRLLRTPTRSLFFAAFDPHTARADGFPNISGLHLDPGSSSKRVDLETAASTNGKRIVIEADAESGTCTWRFVPRAKTEDVLWGDEGPWPRVVIIDGRPVRMTQDQWDIYKLDPMYDCIVHAPPSFTTINRVSQTGTIQPDHAPLFPNPPTPRSLDDNTTSRPQKDLPSRKSDPFHKRQKTMSFDSDKMAVDEDLFFTPSSPASKAPAEDLAEGKKRERFSQHFGDASADSGPSKPRSSKKRTGSSVFVELSINPGSGNREARDARGSPSRTKKSRTRSPDNARREMEQKRAERERKRKADMDARLKARRDALRAEFWRNIGVIPFEYEDLPPHETEESDTSADDERSNTAGETSSDSEPDEEADRIAKIEESRRKLAELEKDKPLWEESARRRQEREIEEELLRKREKATQEEEQHSQERMKAAQKRREERREQDRKERERQARSEQSGRMFVTQPRNTFRWNSRLALERFKRTAADFDAVKFTANERPLSFTQVPWPVIHASFSVQDVDWDAVETFFGEIRRFLLPAEFKELVEKSHKRFHPDRWRSRRLLASVRNETERDLLEVAGSTVAQALTPLWKEATGRI